MASTRAKRTSTKSTKISICRDRNVISALMGIVGFFAFWGVCLHIGSSGDAVGTFLDIPSAAVVIVTPLAALLAIYGWAGVVDACVWIGRKPKRGKGADDAVTFFQLAAAFALAAGFLGTLIGLVIILKHMDDPTRIGPGMAIALLTQLYGVFIAVICIALGAYIARRHKCVATAKAVGFRSASVAGITTIAGTVTVMMIFCILWLSLSAAL